MVTHQRTINICGFNLRASILENENKGASPHGTIIFLHDALGSIAQWKDFPERLCEHAGLNGFVYERRGHGASAPPVARRTLDFFSEEAEILLELTSACGLDKPILFGHSDGATIALESAAIRPDIPSAVIAETPHVFTEETTLEGIRRAIREFDKGGMRDKLGRYHGDGTEKVFFSWTDSWLHPSARDWEIPEKLNSIVCPILVIQGEADEYGSAAHGREIAARARGYVDVFQIPHCGHIPHREAAAQVIDKVGSFLKRAIGPHFKGD